MIDVFIRFSADGKYGSKSKCVGINNKDTRKEKCLRKKNMLFKLIQMEKEILKKKAFF